MALLKGGIPKKGLTCHRHFYINFEPWISRGLLANSNPIQNTFISILYGSINYKI